MFSRRARWDAPVNRYTLALRARRASGAEILDLTESNPTRAALRYPQEQLAEALARASRARYDPDPLGLPSAREAVAAYLSTPADRTDPADVVITASTSEAYSFLFRLLTDPGDVVVIPQPGYPLLEHLASMEMVELRAIDLELHRRWELDPLALKVAVDDRTRAIVAVHPNNPTGSYLHATELGYLQRVAAAADCAVISDEVFYDFPLVDDPFRAGQAAAGATALTFSLGGLSKSCGLPHYKLGWIRVGGPPPLRRRAIDRLETIADNFLSVATPVQSALPELLELGASIRESIRDRIRTSLATLRNATAAAPAVQLLPPEGGWSAVLRLPRLSSDEEFAISLLERSGVVVHPGYFFDFKTDGYVVLSLLTPEEVFGEGVRRIIQMVSG